MANPIPTRPAVSGVIPVFTLGDRLRKARELSGLEMRDLASAIDIHRQTVARYESGHAVPKRHVLLSWSMVTGVDVGWIEHGELSGEDATHVESSSRTTDHEDSAGYQYFSPGKPGEPGWIMRISDYQYSEEREER